MTSFRVWTWSAIFFLVNGGWAVAAGQKVVIVGAGLAGLTAAYDLEQAIAHHKHLKNQGVEVAVYEAKDRPGGRVFTVMLNGQPAELGAQNLDDGGEAATIRRLMRAFGLKVHAHQRMPAQFYYLDQESGQHFQVEKDLMPYFPALTKKEVAGILATLEPKAKNLAEVIEKFFAKYRSQDAKKNQRLALIQKIVVQSMRSYEGGDPQDLSPRYAHGSLPTMMGRFLPETYKKKKAGVSSQSIEGGNSQLVLALAKTLDARLHLNRPLRGVALAEGGGYDLQFGQGQNQEIVHADHLVLAIPATVYKNIHFSDGVLPKERLEQIQRLAYGSHAKILLPGVSTDKKKMTFMTDGVLVWTNSDENWSTLFFTGPQGVMSNSQEFSNGFDLAAKSMGSLTSTPEKQDVVVPTQVLSNHQGAVGISWAADPFILGSYSYFSPATTTALEANVLYNGERLLPLFVPIAERLFFAGEHTTVDQDIRGTMEAAAESGAKVSRLVLKQLQK